MRLTDAEKLKDIWNNPLCHFVGLLLKMSYKHCTRMMDR